MIDSIRDELVSDLRKAVDKVGYEWDITASSITIEEYDDEQRGELSTSIPFQIGADIGANPEAVGEEIAEAQRANGLPDIVTSVTVTSGHINYHLDVDQLVRDSLATLRAEGDAYGARTLEDPDTIFADVSSPNIAKPLHVGHLRNTILSDTVTNILDERGHDVTRDNHIGDWGVQFGNLMHEFVERGDEKKLEEDPIDHLLELYQRFEQRDATLANSYTLLGEDPGEGLEDTDTPEDVRTTFREAREYLQDPQHSVDERTLEDIQDVLQTARELLENAQDTDEVLEILRTAPELTAVNEERSVIENERLYHEENGKEWFARLEQDDEQAVDLWQTFREKSLQRFNETYEELGVEFDLWIGESFYAREGWNDRVIEKALENDIALRGKEQSVFIPIYPGDTDGVEDPETADVETSLEPAKRALETLGPDEDATDLEAFDPFYIVKSDGSTVYGTRDLATIEYRIQEYDIDQSAYVVATEQDRYFAELFAAARKMGYDDIKLKHISYGMIDLPEGSMSTRGGRIITARKVLDAARERARAMVKEQGRDVDDVETVAEQVALATVKYEMIASNRHKDITFDLDKAVSMDGDTGPYVQYAATRTYSVLDDANEGLEFSELDPSVLNEDDIKLVYELSRYPVALETAVERYDAAPLARYLLDLAHTFNSFWHKNRILDDEKAREERLAIVDATRQVFENGLSLLGIETLEEM
jgi:arginyl-tRNA synthetase